MLERIPLAYYALSGLLNFIASFMLATLVFYKNPKSHVNRVFFIFALVASRKEDLRIQYEQQGIMQYIITTNSQKAGK
jgi:hypothetical protein